MSKTHWVAIAQVLLTVVRATGLIDSAALDGLQYIVAAAFGGTLLHRGAKIAGLAPSE